jgi:hypothetical protein
LAVNAKPWPLYLMEKSSDNHWKGGCMGLRARQEVLEKRKSLVQIGF